MIFSYVFSLDHFKQFLRGGFKKVFYKRFSVREIDIVYEIKILQLCCIYNLRQVMENFPCMVHGEKNQQHIFLIRCDNSFPNISSTKA